jgi:hypothetical protein
MENKRVGVKSGGITSGMIPSRLRATTIDSSGDVMEQTETWVLEGLGVPEVEEHRAAAVRTDKISDPVPVSHDPQDDLTMTSGKKAETKVATLKGQEGNRFFQETIFSRLTALISRGRGLPVLKRVSRSGDHPGKFTPSVDSTDEPPFWCCGCFFEPERSRSEDGDPEDSPDPRREGRSNTKDIRSVLPRPTDTHRIYPPLPGKSTFFVYNQSKIENLPAEKLATLEAQLKDVEEENKLLTVEVKSLSAGVRSTELPLVT